MHGIYGWEGLNTLDSFRTEQEFAKRSSSTKFTAHFIGLALVGDMLRLSHWI